MAYSNSSGDTGRKYTLRGKEEKEWKRSLSSTTIKDPI